jgi:formate-dependent nitrite reductase membrane component NrfD
MFLNAGFVAGELLLLLGIVCLVLDLGRQDRILSLFLNPSLSILAIGAYALAFLALLGFLLVLPRLFIVPSIGTAFIRATEIATLLFASVAMFYTGFLLFSIKAVHFWDNPLLPIIFILSSLSSGIAVLVIVGFFSERDEDLALVLKKIILLDVIVLLAEIACTAAFIWTASLAESAAARESLKSLLFGKEALFWWVGFAVCGMLVPLIVELFFLKGSKRSVQTHLAIAAILVLIGAFCLRYGLVEVGTQGDIIDSYTNSDEQNTEMYLDEMTTYD